MAFRLNCASAIETIFLVRNFPELFGIRASLFDFERARNPTAIAQRASLSTDRVARCALRRLGAQRQKRGPRQGRDLRHENFFIFGFKALRLKYAMRSASP
jgi:hypothetical protein